MTPIFVQFTYKKDSMPVSINVDQIVFFESYIGEVGCRIYLTNEKFLISTSEDYYTVQAQISQAISDRMLGKG